jgi:hypothetical protein
MNINEPTAAFIIAVAAMIIALTQQMALNKMRKVLEWIIQHVTIVSQSKSDQEQLEQAMKALGISTRKDGDEK